MYDLFVLGQLMDESMSGYLMQQILQQLVGRNRKISFGMIYPLFKRLSEAGYINLVEEQSDNGNRPKKVASITKEGRIRFKELMEQVVPLNPNLEFTYSVKFRNFHQVDLKLRLKILGDYRNYLLENQNLLKQQFHDLPQTNISQPDLENARWVIDLDQMKTKAALDWVEKALKEFEK